MRAALAERYEVAPSEAPFLLVDVGDHGVDRVIERARERGVAVRDARSFRGLDSHVRVAVRRPTENDRLLAALGVGDGAGEDGGPSGDGRRGEGADV
jgi:histidinol-phosphate/aromatic aminotransferase/cobyric acid decarboxylase-like protein